MPNKFFSFPFVRFCVAGGIGFVVDLSFLYLMIWLGAGPVLGRLFSVCVALLATWQVNRHFTFRVGARATFLELARYLSVNGAGFVVNYAIYTLGVLLLHFQPFMALVIASIIAMGFNFFGNRKWVFQPDETTK